MRLHALDTAKGISVILVVFWHVLMVSSSVGFTPHPVYFAVNAPLLSMRMPLFFFVSGVVVAHSLSGPWKDFFNRKLLDLLWICGLWTVIYTVVQGRPTSYILTSWYRPEIHLWFLWGLIIYRLLSYLLRRHKTLALALSLTLSLLVYHDLPQDFWGSLSTHQRSVVRYGAFFFFAVWYGRQMVSALCRWPWIALAAALMAALLASRLDLVFLLSLSGVMLILSASILISEHLVAVQHAFTFVGSRSLEIFVLHFAMVGPFLKMAKGYSHSALWAVPAVTLACVALAIALRRITDRFAPWLFRAPKGLMEHFGARIGALRAPSQLDVTPDGEGRWR